MLSVAYAECRYAEFQYVKWLYAECRYAECHGPVLKAPNFDLTLFSPCTILYWNEVFNIAHT
jgi:hypothetical protein